MKPAPFDYHAPESIRAALELLREYAPHARVLAGGQNLIAQLNGRERQPACARVNELPTTPERIVEWIRRGGAN